MEKESIKRNKTKQKKGKRRNQRAKTARKVERKIVDVLGKEEIIKKNAPRGWAGKLLLWKCEK